MKPGTKFSFESSVISYGSEADVVDVVTAQWFESSVISYGSEADIDRPLTL